MNPAMDSTTPDSSTSTDALHRIGAVSRLAGVPVTTLRVWESRYAAFTPAKSAGSHRLYGESDVMRARVLRQLTASGHSIGGIARLPLEDLQHLLARSREADARSAPPVAAPEARRLVVVAIGAALAPRLEEEGLQQGLGAQLSVPHVFAGLDDAAAHEGLPAGPDTEDAVVVVARLNAVHEATHVQLLQVAKRFGARGVVVLYNYGAPPVLDAMRAAGLVVRREPVVAADFAHLLRSLVAVPAIEPGVPAPGALIPKRRYSDATLARVAASASSVLCECPRHLAELVGQLASFEEYSHACLNDGNEDAGLHAHLRAVSGTARAMFERALEMAARHGGVPLD
jgi:DNA-binding transcriptional MerR regulator